MSDKFHCNLLYQLKGVFPEMARSVRGKQVWVPGRRPSLGLFGSLKIVLALQLRNKSIICGKLGIGG